MGKPMKVSEARKKLFDLVDDVISEDDSVILIEHRDRTRRAALVSEDYLLFLQASIAELRKQHSSGFSLGGSMTLAGGEDEFALALEKSRAEQAAVAERKFGDL